jgi:hypothetical protein
MPFKWRSESQQFAAVPIEPAAMAKRFMGLMLSTALKDRHAQLYLIV